MANALTHFFLLHKYGPRLDKRQLAEALGVSTSTIMNKSSEGKLGFHTYTEHGHLFADAEAVANHLDELNQRAKEMAAKGTARAPIRRRRTSDLNTVGAPT